MSYKFNYLRVSLIVSKSIYSYNLINLSVKMRFDFCGNLDCPEWVLSEVSILNRMSAIKLKLMLMQINKKLTGQDFDQEKL